MLALIDTLRVGERICRVRPHLPRLSCVNYNETRSVVTALLQLASSKQAFWLQRSLGSDPSKSSLLSHSLHKRGCDKYACAVCGNCVQWPGMHDAIAIGTMRQTALVDAEHLECGTTCASSVTSLSASARDW